MIATLERLNGKVKELAMRNARLETRNAELETTNADLKREAEEIRQQRDRALLDAEYMAVSHKLADSPDTLIDTRRHIARLIRNIDRCIEMLNE